MRKQYGIRVTGGSAPAPLGSFAELGSQYSCSHRLMANLEENGWQEPTAIQRQAVPALLDHKELFAVAPTGVVTLQQVAIQCSALDVNNRLAAQCAKGKCKNL